MNFRSLSGTRDLARSEKESLDFVRRKILGRFHLYGYTLVQPPILERVEPFLERSGEEIRQRMYSFQDPSGRQLCLRPELTIPTSRLYLQELASNADVQRVCYDGIVFRYDPVSFGRLREFRQVGLEYFGDNDRAAADVEAVVLAVEAVAACGLTDTHVVLNDIEIVASVLEELDIELTLRDRIWQRLQSEDTIDSILADLASTDAAVEGDVTTFETVLNKLGPDVLRKFVGDVLSLSHRSVPTGRTVSEVSDRLVSKIQRGLSKPLTEAAASSLREILAIKGLPATALDSLERTARVHRFKSLTPLIERFRERLALLSSVSLPQCTIGLDIGLRRSLQYYTGFIFEIHNPHLQKASEICGGGRYDRLLHSMGAKTAVPAVGFAIGADRVQLAIVGQGRSETADTTHVVDVILAPAGPVDLVECFRVASLLRTAGWATDLELSGRRPKSVIAKANRRRIPYVAFIGQDEVSAKGVRIKDLRTRKETLVNLDSLDSFVQCCRTGAGGIT